MEVKWKQKNPALNTIKEVVMANTGLSEKELLNDEKEYEIRGIDAQNTKSYSAHSVQGIIQYVYGPC